MDRQRANVGMNRPWNTCWSAPSCHNSVPMKTWKSSTPELDPAPSIGRESCSDSKRRRRFLTQSSFVTPHIPRGIHISATYNLFISCAFFNANVSALYTSAGLTLVQLNTAAVAEWLGRRTPWSCWHYGVRKVVSSIPGRGNIIGWVFHPTRWLARFSLIWICLSFQILNLFRTLSSWGSNNYKPSALLL